MYAKVISFILKIGISVVISLRKTRIYIVQWNNVQPNIEYIRAPVLVDGKLHRL